jgi:hypothetical protein
VVFCTIQRILSGSRGIKCGRDATHITEIINAYKHLLESSEGKRTF